MTCSRGHDRKVLTSCRCSLIWLNISDQGRRYSSSEGPSVGGPEALQSLSATIDDPRGRAHRPVSRKPLEETRAQGPITAPAVAQAKELFLR